MSYIKKIIDYFFRHDFPPSVVDKVHRRLAEPDDVAEREEALRELWDGLGMPRDDVRSTRAFERLERALPSEPRHGVHLPYWARVAALWLVPLLSLGVSYYLYRESRVEPRELAFTERFVPFGKRERLLLPDSSEVWLNSGTLLLYPERFDGEKREVYLSGEGYFKIRRLEGQPFVVRARSMRAEVLGTEFNLSAYPDREPVSATLATGSLRVLTDNPDFAPRLLRPGERLVYAPASGMLTVSRVNAADYSDWREGGLFFRNDPFERIMRALERAYDVRVHLRTSAYQANRLTIHFNRGESLETVMALIKEMVPGMEYEIRDREVYVN